MANYCIIYKCGHTADKQLFGNIEERMSYIDWCQDNKLCPECEERLRVEKIRKQNDNSAQSAMANGYVALQGSPKQVAWANTIREKVLGYIDEFQETLELVITKQNYATETAEKERSVVTEIRANILAIGSAKILIDHWKNVSMEDIRDIFRVKRSMRDNHILSDEEFTAKCKAYDIARIEHREAQNPARTYIPQCDVDACRSMFPEQFRQDYPKG